MIPTMYLLFLVLPFMVHGGPIMPQPEQVHLSLGDNPSDMVVTWVTQSPTEQVLVEYGVGKLTSRINGSQTLFIDGGSERRKLYINSAVMINLVPGFIYIYHVGNEYGWSDIFFFRALRNDSDWSPRIALYGDMGNINGKSIPRLQEDILNGMYDAIFHVGDFAYNMDTDDAQYGDEFMRQIEPIAAYAPYMTCPGNHEEAYNFSNYKARFVMPGGNLAQNYYSFNLGPMHVISIQTEFYYFTWYGWKQIEYQYNWLEQDLIEANKPENRAARPWIVVMGHRPMYCSNSDDPEHCPNPDNLIRTGIPIPGSNGVYMYGLEELFYKYGVDLHFWAHEHSYERMWPLYKSKACNGTFGPYIDPPAPVHIVTGSAGCQEDTDPFIPGGYAYSAFRSDDYGYTRMNVYNSTHLYLEQVSDDKNGQVIDSIWYIRNQHGPAVFNCQ